MGTGVCLPATAADLPAVAGWMRAFYAEEHLAYSPACLAALSALAGDPSLGILLVLRDGGGAGAGYAVLTFGFSLERGGRTALLDELYVLPAARGQGFGRAAVGAALEAARAAGCAAVHLEVDRVNRRARRLYASLGFADAGRDFLTRVLT
jgi:GNAT superfamily N-acetyltransferase